MDGPLPKKKKDEKHKSKATACSPKGCNNSYVLATSRRLRLPLPDPDFDILLSYEPIIMHRPLPFRILEFEIEAHHQFRNQLIDFHQANVLAHAGAGTFAKL